MSGGVMERLQGWMTPERSIALQGLGTALSQLDAGVPVNLSHAHQALARREQNAQMRKTLQDSGLMQQFNPQQRQLLMSMEPAAAQKIIAQAMFGAQPQPTKGVTIGDRLVNPVTGELIADFSTPEPKQTVRIVSGDEAAKFGLPSDGRAFELTFDENMSLSNASAIGGGGTNVTVNNVPETGPIPAGQQLVTDPVTGDRSLQNIPGGPAEAAEATAEREKQVALDEAVAALDLIQSVKSDPALGSVTGNFQGRLPAGIPGITGGQSGANLEPKILQLQGKAFLQAFESLKGGGQITQIEGNKATDAIARLQRVQDEAEFILALTDLEEVIMAGIRRARGSAPSGSDPLGIRK